MPHELECDPELIVELSGLLHGIGVRIIDEREHAVPREGLAFVLLTCARDGAIALVSICRRAGDATRHVNVSMSLLRILQFWHWREDWKLAKAIAYALTNAGGVPIP
jgi:hypothetical protein